VCAKEELLFLCNNNTSSSPLSYEVVWFCVIVVWSNCWCVRVGGCGFCDCVFVWCNMWWVGSSTIQETRTLDAWRFYMYIGMYDVRTSSTILVGLRRCSLVCRFGTYLISTNSDVQDSYIVSMYGCIVWL
jgi:hypothetical protein